MNFTLFTPGAPARTTDDTHEATSAGRERARFDESNRTPCRNRQSTVAPALLPSGPVGSQRRGEHLHAGRCSRPVPWAPSAVVSTCMLGAAPVRSAHRRPIRHIPFRCIVSAAPSA